MINFTFSFKSLMSKFVAPILTVLVLTIFFSLMLFQKNTFADYTGPSINNPTGHYTHYDMNTNFYDRYKSISISRPSLKSSVYRIHFRTYSNQGTTCSFSGKARVMKVNNHVTMYSHDPNSNCRLNLRMNRADGGYGSLSNITSSLSGAACNPEKLCGGRDGFNMYLLPSR
jgi:hypothetical protein